MCAFCTSMYYGNYAPTYLGTSVGTYLGTSSRNHNHNHVLYIAAMPEQGCHHSGVAASSATCQMSKLDPTHWVHVHLFKHAGKCDPHICLGNLVLAISPWVSMVWPCVIAEHVPSLESHFPAQSRRALRQIVSGSRCCLVGCAGSNILAISLNEDCGRQGKYRNGRIAWAASRLAGARVCNTQYYYILQTHGPSTSVKMRHLIGSCT